MRRGLRAAALVMALVLLLGTVAAATDTTETTGSIYDAANVAKKNGIQVAPLDGCTVKFAEGSEALTVTYTNENLKENDMVIVLLLKSSEAVTDSDKAEKVATTLTNKTIQYIDQADVETAGTVTFRVFPQNYSNGVIRLIWANKTSGGVNTATVAAVNVEYILGDVSGLGKIDSYDALLVLEYYAHTHADGTVDEGYELSARAKAAADVSGDGIIDSYDALMILEHYVFGYEFSSARR